MAVLVGKPAPDFCCPAVLATGEMVEKFHLADAIHNRYALLFFYPLDFSALCPSELINLQQRMPEFTARAVEVISISIDSHFTHQTWRDTAFEDGGLGAVSYTMVADLTQQIARDYDVQTSSGVAYRAAFLIDPRGVVRSQIVNDLPLSRNIDELLRLVDALQCHLSNSKSP